MTDQKPAPKPRSKRIYVLWGVGLIAGILAVLVATYLWHGKSRPQFIGYAPSPRLQVQLQPNSGNAADVQRVCRAAKEHFQKVRSSAQRERFWAEPVFVHETESFWLVGFKRKERVFLVGGKRVTEQVEPDSASVRVEKGDMSCRLLPSR